MDGRRRSGIGRKILRVTEANLELMRLRDEEGLTSEQVIKQYIFLTAGACGP